VRRFLSIQLTIFAVLIPSACYADGPAWGRFRGPNGSGESDAAPIPLKWTTKDCRWRVELPGVGHSSPVVCGDRVVITTAGEKDATLTVFCLGTSDGRQLWKRQFPAKPYAKSNLNTYASSTPALDADHAYVAWTTPEHYTVASLALKDGGEAWRRTFDPFDSEHGFGPSPIVWEDLLIVPDDQNGPSSVFALDRATGKTRWHSGRRSEKAAFATPCIFQPQGGKPQLILSSWAHGVTSLDPRSGKTYWEVPVFQYRVVGSPTVAAGLVFAAAGTGGIGRQMVAIRPGDPDRATEAKIVYRVETAIPYVPTPVAKGDWVFLWQDHGIVSCLDGPTGKVHWRERIGGDYFTSPVRVADRIYCASRNGEMVVLAASDRYQLLARFPLGERTHSTPAVAHGSMYVRTVSHLMAIGGVEMQ
jgi:outer membrane protein assembly factor BamB